MIYDCLLGGGGFFFVVGNVLLSIYFVQTGQIHGWKMQCLVVGEGLAVGRVISLLWPHHWLFCVGCMVVWLQAFLVFFCHRIWPVRKYDRPVYSCWKRGRLLACPFTRVRSNGIQFGVLEIERLQVCTGRISSTLTERERRDDRYRCYYPYMCTKEELHMDAYLGVQPVIFFPWATEASVIKATLCDRPIGGERDWNDDLYFRDWKQARSFVRQYASLIKTHTHRDQSRSTAVTLG